jgi:hypothetical protein
MECLERRRLLARFADAARIYRDADAHWQAAAEMEDDAVYREIAKARQDAKLELVRNELDQHSRMHCCEPKQ